MVEPSQWMQMVEANPDHSTWFVKRFRDMAAAGQDLDGEARLVDAMVPRRSRLLDAGCGYGRVASELTRLGHHVVGVDADPDLVAIARDEDRDTHFLVADLARLSLRTEQEFHCIVLAGNVVPYLADGTLGTVLERLAAHLAPLGHLVAGFGLPGSLPEAAAKVDLRTYDRLADAAGLAFIARYATWDRQPFADGGDYAVSVHRRRAG